MDLNEVNWEDPEIAVADPPELRLRDLDDLMAPVGEHSVLGFAPQAIEGEWQTSTGDYLAEAYGVWSEFATVLVSTYGSPKLCCEDRGDLTQVSLDSLPPAGLALLGERYAEIKQAAIPTSSWLWPLFNDWNVQDEVLQDMAWDVRHLPVVVVRFGGIVGFSLTAAGDDLTYKIGEAAIRLGYRPHRGLDKLSRKPDTGTELLVGLAMRRSWKNASLEADLILRGVEAKVF